MSTSANRGIPTLVLRPLGYLLVTAVWLVLFVVVLIVLVGPYFVIDAGYGAEGGSAFAIENIVIVVVTSPILGPALGFVLSVSASSTALAALAFARSLQPQYAKQRLTFTTWSRSTVGPPNRIGPSATSLLPTEATPTSKRLAVLSISAMNAPGRMVVASMWFAAAWLITVGAARWTLTGIGLVVAVFAVAVLVVLGFHTARQAYARPAPTDSDSRTLRRLAEARRRASSRRSSSTASSRRSSST